MNYRNLLSIALISLHFIFIAPKDYVNAQETPDTAVVRVSPIIINVSLQPGSKQIYTVRIDNLTGSPMPIRGTVESFDPSDEAVGYSPKPLINPEQSLAQWIQILSPDSIIPAHDFREFFVKINIPASVPIGGYYAMMYFSPVYPGQTVSSKIGVVTLANIGIQDSENYKISVEDFSFNKILYDSEPIDIAFRIKNTSLNYFSVKPTLNLSPVLGASDALDFDEKIILPQKIRSWKRTISILNTKWGVFKAVLTIRPGTGKAVSVQKYIVVFPFKMSLLILLSISVLSVLILKRKNLRTAFTILVYGNKDSGHISPDVTSIAPAPETHKRIDPDAIIRAVSEHQGSIQRASENLHIHRSTIHRWMKKIGTQSPGDSSTRITRKSTRPHTLRTSTLSKVTVNQIIELRKKKQLTPSEIRTQLHLTVSTRTILRVLKSHNLTRKYKHSLIGRTIK